MLFNKVSVAIFVFGLLMTLQGLGELFSLNGQKKKGEKKGVLTGLFVFESKIMAAWLPLGSFWESRRRESTPDVGI